MQQIAAQVVGFIAMALCIGCFQCKSKNTLLAMQLAGNAVFILHYMMLGAFSGCASLILLVLSNLMLLFRLQGRSWARGWGWRWIFSGLTVLVGLATWENLFSLLPCAAGSAVGAFIGSLVGARYARRIPSGHLRKYFSVVLFAMAVLVLLQAGGIL